LTLGQRLIATMSQFRPVIVQLLRPIVLVGAAALLIEGILPILLAAQAGPLR
jgi:hypothetical protein